MDTTASHKHNIYERFLTNMDTMAPPKNISMKDFHQHEYDGFLITMDAIALHTDRFMYGFKLITKRWLHITTDPWTPSHQDNYNAWLHRRTDL